MNEIKKEIKKGPTHHESNGCFQPCKHSQETYPICGNIIGSKKLLNLTWLLFSYPDLVLSSKEWLDKED